VEKTICFVTTTETAILIGKLTRTITDQLFSVVLLHVKLPYSLTSGLLCHQLYGEIVDVFKFYS